MANFHEDLLTAGHSMATAALSSPMINHQHRSRLYDAEQIRWVTAGNPFADVRAGPNAGRRKLLLALAMAAEPTLRVVREEPSQAASSASPTPLVPEAETGASETTTPVLNDRDCPATRAFYEANGKKGRAKRRTKTRLADRVSHSHAHAHAAKRNLT